MKEIKSWSDVTTRQYIEIFNLEESNADDMEYIIKQICILYSMTENEVENLTLGEFNIIKNQMLNLKSEIPEQTSFKKELKLCGDTYTFRESLIDFTLGEWMDLEAIMSNVKTNLHKVMGVFYRKNGITKYDAAIVDETAERFLDVDVETVLSAFFLFHLYAMNYTPSDIKDCSAMEKIQMEIAKMNKELKKMNRKKEPLEIPKKRTKKKQNNKCSG